MYCLRFAIFLSILSLLLLGNYPINALNPVTNYPIKLTQRPNLTTYVKVLDFNSLVMQITEKDFKFRGLLKRNESQEFIGSNGQFRVVLNPYDGHVMVFNAATGAELYNYNIDPVSGVGEDPTTMCDPTTETC
ncbi:MAG: hypothetical protein AAGF26_06895 [Cyanobacteria bacterium P01_G01_bin.49]